MRIVPILLAIIGFALLATPADARRGVAFGGSGEQIELVKDLPDTKAFSDDDGPLDLGYLHTEYSFLFMPIAATGTDGRFVFYRGDSYYEMTDELHSLVKRETGSDPTKDYEFGNMRFRWGIFGLLGFIAFGVVGNFIRKAMQESTDDLRQMEAAVARGANPMERPTPPAPQRLMNQQAAAPSISSAAAPAVQRAVFGRKK